MRSWMIDALCFNVIWAVAVFSQSPVWVVALTITWLLARPLPSKELLAVAVSAMAGIILDMLLTMAGWMTFESNATSLATLPVWLMGLWVASARFMLLLSRELSLSDPVLGVVFLAGAIASYRAGESLGIVDIAWESVPLFSAFALFWLMLPAVCWVIRRCYA